MEGKELIRMERICKNFPGVKALNNVSFAVHEGEVHALLGENGAGKSTLIKILSGVYLPDEGEIYVKGKRVDIHNVHDAQKLNIGIIFQECNLCPDLNVADNIYIGRHKHNIFGIVDRKQIESETQKILNRLGLKSIKPTDIIRRMSVSQMQMVEIAKAISFNYDVIIFDEPTAALSETEIKTLFDIIKGLCNDGKGIIYISHRMEELSQIAHNVTVLRDGMKIDESFKYAEKTMDELVFMMVGREIRNKYPIYTRKIGDVLMRVDNLKSKKLDIKHIEVRSGEIVGIAGLMGAGRTEMAKAIFGADNVEHIEIEIAGKKVKNRTPSEAIAHGITYLTEDRKREGLALRMNCEKNINMAIWDVLGRNGLVNNNKAILNANRQCEKLQIKTPSLLQATNLLSGGNQQKVVLGKLLSCESSVIILDEPTRGIDVGVKYEIYKIINQLSDKGIGIIMISSELPEVLGMSDRIYTMCEGKINGEIKTEDATQELILTLIAGIKKVKIVA